MPPAVLALALVATLIPAALRAALGWPRALPTAWLAAAAAVVGAQAIGELAGLRIGVVGDTQMLFAAAGATLASLAVAGLEGSRRRRR